MKFALKQCIVLVWREGGGCSLCEWNSPPELPFQASARLLPKGVRSVCDFLPWRYSNAFGSVPAGWKWVQAALSPSWASFFFFFSLFLQQAAGRGLLLLWAGCEFPPGGASQQKQPPGGRSCCTRLLGTEGFNLNLSTLALLWAGLGHWHGGAFGDSHPSTGCLVSSWLGSHAGF